jgi:hypothetical protein
MRIPAPPRSQEGSAYIVALLVLVVLTVMGIGLAMITQTEVQVGANERMVNRIFYAADATISVTAMRMIVTNDTARRIYYLDDPITDGVNLGLRNQVTTTGMVPWSELPCNLCQINNANHYPPKKYVRAIMLTNVTAQRLATASAETAPLAERTLGAMIDAQPLESTIMRGHLTTYEDPEHSNARN